MAEMSLSATETALENQRIGGLQILVAVLCTMVQVCDGYDLNAIGWAVPSLIHLWHLPPPAFTGAFVWSSIGIMVGALSAGPIGDRFGRRPLLIGSIAIFGVASLLSAFAGSIAMLSLLRFFTGLGIGGGFSGATALTGDYAPQRRRGLMIMATFTGAPIGGFVGGQAVALLLPHFGWKVIFVIGGIFPLVLLLAMLLWLPESPRFLAAKAKLAPRHQALLRRLDIDPGQAALHPVDLALENPVRMLFGKGYALQTVLLWVIFFCSLMDLFLFGYWLPTVMNLIGLTPAQAVFASSLSNFGGMLAVLYMGPLLDHFGPERPLAVHYVISAVFIAVISLVALPYALLMAVVFGSGLTIIGSQTAANATCGTLYPARMRTSGIGWALGIGRLGGIAAPALGGYLLSLHMKPTHIFLAACLFALIAAAATALLTLRPKSLLAREAGREGVAASG
jgi:AAHS family 4-hydroxybenzoate transporter-like MFS transporter